MDVEGDQGVQIPPPPLTQNTNFFNLLYKITTKNIPQTPLANSNVMSILSLRNFLDLKRAKFKKMLTDIANER